MSIDPYSTNQNLIQLVKLPIQTHMCLLLIYTFIPNIAPKIKAGNTSGGILTLNRSSTRSTKDVFADKHLLGNSNSLDLDGEYGKVSHYDCQFRNQKADPCFLGSVQTEVVSTEGESPLLQCFIYNVNFSTVVISWWREGQIRELTLGLEVTNPRLLLPRTSYQDWSLQILNVTASDAGMYVCQINLEFTMEKTYRLQVQPLSRSTQAAFHLLEQGFVKDEGVRKHPKQRLRIQGQVEGHVGSQLTIVCIGQSQAFEDGFILLWSHQFGLNRIYLSPDDKHTEVLNKASLDTNDPVRPAHTMINSVILPSTYNAYLRYNHFQNGTVQSILSFNSLEMKHAGLWRCSRMRVPEGRIIAETQAMIYVRTRKPPTRYKAYSQPRVGDSSRANRLYGLENLAPLMISIIRYRAFLYDE